MAAAKRAGLYWPTICRGHGRCGRCLMVIESGVEYLTDMTDEERTTLLKVRGACRPERERLACQTRIRGHVTVRRRGVKPHDTWDES